MESCHFLIVIILNIFLLFILIKYRFLYIFDMFHSNIDIFRLFFVKNKKKFNIKVIFFLFILIYL